MREVPRHWQPLVEIDPDQTRVPPELVAVVMQRYAKTEAEAREFLKVGEANYRFFVNNLYQVQVGLADDGGHCLHINIRRKDGGMFKDWLHFQQIKNEVAGPEREAVEIYPAESRKVDTSNKWHLWVLPENMQFKFGWSERDVDYNDISNVPGLRQRPL